jgi:hypothetical protein
LQAGRADVDTGETRRLFTDILNPNLYPADVFAPVGENLILLTGDTLLGVTSGPRFARAIWKHCGATRSFCWRKITSNWRKKSGGKRPTKSRGRTKRWRSAGGVSPRPRCVAARRRPQIYFNIAETLLELQQPENAGRMFLLVVNQVNQMEMAEKAPDTLADIRMWRMLAQHRLRDLETRASDNQ